MAAAAAKPEQPCKKVRRVGRDVMHAIVGEMAPAVNPLMTDATGAIALRRPVQ